MSMSTPPTDWTDWTDDRTTDHDPYNVVPDGFVDAWNSQTSETVTTIPEALAVAERAPSSTGPPPRSAFFASPVSTSTAYITHYGSTT